MTGPVPQAPPVPGAAPAGPTRWWADPFAVLLALVLLGLAGWMLPGVLRAIADPWRLNDDMRTWVGVYSPELPPPPDVARPFWQWFRTSPPGYLALMAAVRQVGDPLVVNKWGTVLLLGLAIVPLALVGREAAGAPGALATAALAFHADVFIDRAAGCMPRGFAIPLLAWMLYALVTRRVRLYLWLVPVGLLIYPPTVIVGGATGLAWLVWLWRTGELRAVWRPYLPHVVAAGVASLLIGIGLLVILRGNSAVSYAEALRRPPLGPGGRGLVPFDAPWRVLRNTAALGLMRNAWMPVPAAVTGVLIALGVGLVLARKAVPPRVLGACACLVLGSGVVYAVSRTIAFRLYLPQRMLFYSMPILVTVLWPACCAALARRVTGTPHAGSAGALLAVLIAVAVGGPGRAGRDAFRENIRPAQPLVEAVAGLPPESVTSGPYYLLDTLYGAAHRHMYLSYEGMVPLLQDSWAWMEPRLWRHINAYYADDWAEVRRLRDEGVTHMLVRLRDFKAGRPPQDHITFEPFVGEIRRLHARRAPDGFVFAHPPPASVVFQWQDYVLVDLARVPATGPPS